MTEILFSVSPRCSAGVCWVVGRLRQNFCCRALRRHCLTRATLNTSSASSSDCSRDDRFSKHFRKCRNREGGPREGICPPPRTGLLVLNKRTGLLNKRKYCNVSHFRFRACFHLCAIGHIRIVTNAPESCADCDVFPQGFASAEHGIFSVVGRGVGRW